MFLIKFSFFTQKIVLKIGTKPNKVDFEWKLSWGL